MVEEEVEEEPEQQRLLAIWAVRHVAQVAVGEVPTQTQTVVDAIHATHQLGNKGDCTQEPISTLTIREHEQVELMQHPQQVPGVHVCG